MSERYLVVPGLDATADLYEMLLSNGISKEMMRLYADRQIVSDSSTLPLRRFGPSPAIVVLATLSGCLIGVIVVFLTALLTNQYAETGTLAILVGLFGALAGGLFAQRRHPASHLKCVQDKLRLHDVLITLEIPDGQFEDLEKRIDEHYKMVRIIGRDSLGTPPYP